MSLTNAQLRAAAATGLQPSRTNASGSTGAGQSITVLLHFVNTAYQPLDIIDALEAKYGAGKVTSDKDAIYPNNLQLNIIP